MFSKVNSWRIALEIISREWKLRYEGNFEVGVYGGEKITFENEIRESFIAYNLLFCSSTRISRYRNRINFSF